MNEHAMLWLSVEPSLLDETGRAMAAHAEIPFVAATTGPTNLLASARMQSSLPEVNPARTVLNRTRRAGGCPRFTCGRSPDRCSIRARRPA